MELVTAIAVLLGATLVVALVLVGRKALSSRSLLLPDDASAVPGSGPAKALPVGPPYQLVASRHGWMLVNPNDMYLGRAILDYGECCELEVAFLLKLLALRPGDVVEIGTNIGTHTVPMAKSLAQGGRRLIAFEPQPFIFQNLCANLALNGLSNVTAWPFACGDRESTVYFSHPDYGAGGNFGGVEMSRERREGSVAVPCRTVDGVVDSARIGLIKVDVEGFELQALQGAEATLARHRPLLYVENDRIDRSEALVEWLWQKEYRLWWHTPLLFNPDNFFGNADNSYEGVGSFNMLCVPRERPVPVDGLREVTVKTHPLASQQ